jgi:holo-[acyl-carrier protein] synthase|tara:strand:+ start:313 stop:690 length:378 start_codon:yes stop_codon:yes gene_type:complete
MIFGIGTDIVEVERIKNLSSISKFAKKILSQKELNTFNSLNKDQKVYFLSKQFAAKEAISKALGTGIGHEASLNNIEILRDEKGKPFFNAINELSLLISDLGITKTHVSLADESNYAIAMVILEK